MSYNFGPTSLRPGTLPCPGGSVPQNLQQIDVPYGSLVNVSFGGAPPYNLTQTVWKGDIGVLNCATTAEVLNESWYMWDVRAFPNPWNTSSETTSKEYQIVGDAVILLAIELNGPELRYFNSANFTITEQGIIQTSSSPKSHIVGIKSLFLTALIILPALHWV